MRRRLVLGVKNTQNRAAQHSREKEPLARGQESPTPVAPQEPLSFFWVSFFFLASPLHLTTLLQWSSLVGTGIACPFFLCKISVVIYHSPPFILLLHLSVIHAYSRVHVPSTTLSDALWAAVAPISLSRSHIHINGVRVLAVGI